MWQASGGFENVAQITVNTQSRERGEREAVLSTLFTVIPLRHHCFCGCVLRMSHCTSTQRAAVIYLTRFSTDWKPRRIQAAAPKHTSTAAVQQKIKQCAQQRWMWTGPQNLRSGKIKWHDCWTFCHAVPCLYHQPWQQRHRRRQPATPHKYHKRRQPVTS